MRELLKASRTSLVLLAWISLVNPASGLAQYEGGKEANGGGNPCAKACKDADGSLARTRNEHGDEDSFCRFGRAHIECWTFFRVGPKESGIPQAVTAFLELSNLPLQPDIVDSCGPWYAKEEVALLDEGDPMQICKFADGSALDARTLISGKQIQGNEKLRGALSNRMRIVDMSLGQK